MVLFSDVKSEAPNSIGAKYSVEVEITDGLSQEIQKKISLADKRIGKRFVITY